MAKAEEYRIEQRPFAGIEIKITTYKIGRQYYAHVANVDPGATIARSEGNSREEAIQKALEKVKNKLS